MKAYGVNILFVENGKPKHSHIKIELGDASNKIDCINQTIREYGNLERLSILSIKEGGF